MKKKIQLSKRLQTIASFLPKGTYFADIGSDHAYLPCYVCLHDEHATAIAGEVRTGPYRRAKETVDSYELHHRIDVRLGDGLSILTPNDRVDAIVIAGMGAKLIETIIAEGKENFSHVKRFILQPNNDANRLRNYFYQSDFTLSNETILEENDHIYEILVFDAYTTLNPYDLPLEIEKQLLFGPFLLREKSAFFTLKWKREYEKIQHVLNEMRKSKEYDKKKMTEFSQRATWIKEVVLCQK